MKRLNMQNLSLNKTQPVILSTAKNPVLSCHSRKSGNSDLLPLRGTAVPWQSIFLLTLFLSVFLFTPSAFASKGKEINLKLDDLKFESTTFLEGKIKVDLPKNEAEFVSKNTLYEKLLVIEYTPGPIGGYGPVSLITVVCPRSKFNDKKMKDLISVMKTNSFTDGYYNCVLGIYFDDLELNSFIIKVSSAFFGKERLSDKTSVQSRLSENEGIFNRILESVELLGSDGKYFKPKFERLPDKIEDRRKKTKNDPMWEGIFPPSEPGKNS